MMKKRWIAMLLCMVMALSTLGGCSGGTDATQAAGTQPAAESGAGSGAQGEENGGEASGSAFRVLYSGEVTTLNYLITATTNDFQISANVIDTLLEYDNKGELLPSLATDWAYDEAANTWTFTLREGQKWVDHTGAAVADVTAQDFVDSMKYILTPSNTSATSQMLFGVIENAEEYYQGLAGEDGFDEIDFSEVGVKALDEHTLQYTLADQVPYFLSMLTYVCFMPAYGPQLEEQGGSFGTTAESMYYCGAYYISRYEPQVQMVLTKNGSNWSMCTSRRLSAPTTPRRARSAPRWQRGARSIIRPWGRILWIRGWPTRLPAPWSAWSARISTTIISTALTSICIN